MDRAFEGIINVVFYFVLLCVVLAVLGVNPFVLFASISGFVLGFAFMVSICLFQFLWRHSYHWRHIFLSFPNCFILRSDLHARSTLKEFSSSWFAIPMMWATALRWATSTPQHPREEALVGLLKILTCLQQRTYLFYRITFVWVWPRPCSLVLPSSTYFLLLWRCYGY